MHEEKNRKQTPTRNNSFNQDTQELSTSLAVRKRQFVIFLIFIVFAIVGLYYVLPHLAGIGDTWRRLDNGNPYWLAVACALELASFFGYIWLFRAVFCGGTHINWMTSYEISLAGVVATRLFATAGAGGVALTVWALRKLRVDRREVASGMVTFLVVLYGVYMSVLVLDGVMLYIGVFNEPAPFGLTLLPAAFAVLVILISIGLALIPTDIESRASRAMQSGRFSKMLRQLAAAPASVALGIRNSFKLLRRGEWGLVGAILWWGFDILTLWACFQAFGNPPGFSILVMCYFVGMLGNLLPLPGGIGGVDGGMIGAFIGFGVSSGLAVVAVLTYRAFAFWLPMVPGTVAYFQLRAKIRQIDIEEAAARGASSE